MNTCKCFRDIQIPFDQNRISGNRIKIPIEIKLNNSTWRKVEIAFSWNNDQSTISFKKAMEYGIDPQTIVDIQNGYEALIYFRIPGFEIEPLFHPVLLSTYGTDDLMLGKWAFDESLMAIIRPSHFCVIPARNYVCAERRIARRTVDSEGCTASLSIPALNILSMPCEIVDRSLSGIALVAPPNAYNKVPAKVGLQKPTQNANINGQIASVNNLPNNQVRIGINFDMSNTQYRFYYLLFNNWN
jgi:hypothetical protein